ncbi:MAG: hypothetical protein HQM10_23155 [Candidatus Riflebacteria bacterium]|nr:hypothetical protein [Candidatus Riflebacteria bacterium]
MKSVNLTNIFGSPPEGIIEIEENYLRFLIPEGSGWNSHTVQIPNGDVFGTLKKAVPKYLATLMQATVVLWSDVSTRVLPFPVEMSESEILEHLTLKSEDYFSSTAEMIFRLRPLGLIDQNNREYLVFSLNKLFFNRLLNTFSEVGCTLNRVTNSLEAVTGRFHQLQSKYGYDASACIISLGYSQVNMLVLRDGEIIAVRTSITGAVRELEKSLCETLKVKTEKIEEILSGNFAEKDSNTIEIIQQNMRELFARITPFFAFVRSKEKESSKNTLYLSLPCLEIKGLKELLEKSFSIPVKILGETPSGESNRYDWLQGALYNRSISFLTPPSPMFKFSVTSKIAWMFTIFFLCVPFGIIRINHDRVKFEIEQMRSKEESSRQFLQSTDAARERYAGMQDVLKIARAEIPNKYSVAYVLAEIAKNAPSNLRISKIDYQPDSGSLSISGVSVDADTALLFWTNLKKLPWFSSPKINFSPGSSLFSKCFTVTGGVKQES